MNDSIVSPAPCPRCGATALPNDAPEGLCPRCLAALHFAPETVLTGAPASTEQRPLPVEELAPHFPQLGILECLGRGGMGVVYKARQKSLNRIVALKLLAPERVRDAKFAERFTEEARALATLILEPILRRLEEKRPLPVEAYDRPMQKKLGEGFFTAMYVY
jgi:hypothetical protein